MLIGHRTKWLGLAAWLVLAMLAAPLAGKVAEVEKADPVEWLPKTAEATRALERAEEAFPGSETPVAVVVYAREAGLTADDRAYVDADREAFGELAKDGQVSPAIPSEDGNALLVSFPLATADEDAQASAIEDIRDRLADAPSGLQNALTGEAGAASDIENAFGGIDGMLIAVTATIVALLLLVIYRSPVLWLVPLMSAGVAIQLAQAVVYLLGKYADVTVNPQSQGIMTVLVFGVGTDYALLLIARYREELRQHADRHQAMGLALRRSFPAILASAGTVTVGLLCLLAAQMNNVRSLGPVGAVAIASALIVMTSLLPILLLACGRWVFWPFVPRYEPGATSHDVAQDHGIWSRIASFVDQRRRVIWATAVGGLALLSLGALNLSLGLPASETYTKDVDSVVGQQLVAEHYPGGSASPAEITTTASTVEDVAASAADVPGVAEVQPAERSPDGEWGRFDAVLADPPDSDAAKETIDQLRSAVHEVPGSEALVGGDTATQLDTERATERDNQVVLPLVLAGVLIVLMLLLRALVAPLLLIASVLVSFAAAMGLAGLIFQAIGYPNIGYDLPIFAALFLVALGVDYTIFLMTRAREETEKLGHHSGMLRALAVTGGVITSAGIVLAATFAALTVLPLVSMLQLGIVVAGGVLLDALVVRTLLVPALSLSVGRRIWWPSRLARRPSDVQARPEEAQLPPMERRGVG